MPFKRIPIVVIGLFLLALLAMTACGPSSETVIETVVVTEIVEGETVEKIVEVTPFPEEMLEEPMEESIFADEEQEGAVGVNGEEIAASPDDWSRDDLVAALPQDRLIIKNGEIDLLVEDANIAIDRVTQIAVDNGGYVLSSQAWFEGDVKLATLTIAVRSEMFEVAMRRLREIAIEVLRENTSGQDVSSEYVDLESRLRNLEATRERIAGFLDRAKTVQEALKINEDLAQIEAEIEQVKGRMNFLAGRSAFSTITVTIQIPVEIPPTPTPTPTSTPTPTPTPTATLTPTPWSPAYTLDSAVKTQTGLLRGLTDAALWIGIVLLPYAVVGGGIVFGVRAVVRRRPPSHNPTPTQPEKEQE